MQVKVDRGGRVVIPKPLLTALGTGPDTELELIVEGAGLRLEPISIRERGIEERDGLPLLSHVEDVVLTDRDVQRLRDEPQR
ncbi:MAG: AbrB family transcriptional regulator [Acidimicrobiia bacterium]|nr:AbrB family transcriptional regulator [Acidimicrobiia bacterium]